MADVFKQGGTAGQPAYVAVDDAGSLAVSDGSTTATLTQAILGGLTKISGFVWDLTGATTGAAYVSITDNLAAAFAFKEGSNSYLTLRTTDNNEALVAGKLIIDPVQATVAMGDATHKLIRGAAPTTGQTLLVAPFITADAESSGTENLWLPLASTYTGRLEIWNIGGESIILKDSNGADTLINGGAGLTIAAGKSATLLGTGSAWFGFTN